jgi:hypothetical protein
MRWGTDGFTITVLDLVMFTLSQGWANLFYVKRLYVPSTEIESSMKDTDCPRDIGTVWLKTDP